jgi:putative transcriptional regulator
LKLRRVFKTKFFTRWMRKTELTNSISSWPVRPWWRFAMKTKTKAKSPILAAVHETARDLHDAGFINMRRMKEYDSLCLAPIEPYTSEKIVKLRQRHHLSQAVLASVLNTSISTVRQWEIGAKRPSGPSLKLLDLLDRKGLEALI